MYVSIDLVEEVIERQLRKYKNKLIDKEQNAAQLSKAFIDEDAYEEEEIEIIRSKKFAMKPMDAEEACVQMELLGHNFFVFRNSDTEEVNVVYKRKGNTYGLIEPEY
jgi:putative sigma-54 modulation protein